MNVLKDIIPAAHRKLAYQIYALLGVVAGAAQIVFATHSTPDWFTTALQVYAYLGAVLGLTAAANVRVRPVDHKQ